MVIVNSSWEVIISAIQIIGWHELKQRIAKLLADKSSYMKIINKESIILDLMSCIT